MRPIIEVYNLKHAYHCLDKKCPHIILGNAEFATRLSYSFNQNEITEIVKCKQQTKIWIKVNTFFFEHQIEPLIAYLKWLATLNIDYVIFQDYAVAQINHEHKLNLNLHYNPESLVTSYGQFQFFENNHFSGCFLARELMLSEIKTICQHKNSLILEIQGFGFGTIMHSRWKLLNNFVDFYDIHFKNQPVWIKERLRKLPNLMFGDTHGTHMLTGYLINGVKQIQQLDHCGVDLYQITFLMLSEAYALSLTDVFLQAFEDLNNQCFKPETYERLFKTIIGDQYVMSPGFLGNINSLPHLIKEPNNE